MENHDSFYEEVGRRIRDARKRRTPKLTQDGLSQLVGLTRTSITNVEQGRQKILLHTFTEIAIALQVEPASLIPSANTPLAHLDDALKNRPPAEKNWIMSTVIAAQSRRDDRGT